MASNLDIGINIRARTEQLREATSAVERLRREANKPVKVGGSSGFSLAPDRRVEALYAAAGGYRARRAASPLGTIAGGPAGAGLARDFAYAGGIGLAVSGMGLLVRRGVEYNKTIEMSQLGLAALIRQFRSDKISSFSEAMTEAGKVIGMLKGEIDKGLPASLPELIRGYQASAGAMFKANIPLEKQVKLMATMTKAISGMNLTPDQITQETRAILTGNITKDAIVAKTLGITGADITSAKSEDRLYEYLMKKLSGFGEALDASRESFSAKMARLDQAYNEFAGKATKGFYEALKQGAEPLIETLKNISAADLENASKLAAGALELLVKAVGPLARHFNDLVVLIASITAYKGASALAGRMNPNSVNTLARAMQSVGDPMTAPRLVAATSQRELEATANLIRLQNSRSEFTARRVEALSDTDSLRRRASALRAEAGTVKTNPLSGAVTRIPAALTPAQRDEFREAFRASRLKTAELNAAAAPMEQAFTAAVKDARVASAAREAAVRSASSFTARFADGLRVGMAGVITPVVGGINKAVAGLGAVLGPVGVVAAVAVPLISFLEERSARNSRTSSNLLSKGTAGLDAQYAAVRGGRPGDLNRDSVMAQAREMARFLEANRDEMDDSDIRAFEGAVRRAASFAENIEKHLARAAQNAKEMSVDEAKRVSHAQNLDAVNNAQERARQGVASAREVGEYRLGAVGAVNKVEAAIASLFQGRDPFKGTVDAPKGLDEASSLLNALNKRDAGLKAGVTDSAAESDLLDRVQKYLDANRPPPAPPPVAIGSGPAPAPEAVAPAPAPVLVSDTLAAGRALAEKMVLELADKAVFKVVGDSGMDKRGVDTLVGLRTSQGRAESTIEDIATLTELYASYNARLAFIEKTARAAGMSKGVAADFAARKTGAVTLTEEQAELAGANKIDATTVNALSDRFMKLLWPAMDNLRAAGNQAKAKEESLRSTNNRIAVLSMREGSGRAILEADQAVSAAQRREAEIRARKNPDPQELAQARGDTLTAQQARFRLLKQQQEAEEKLDASRRKLMGSTERMSELDTEIARLRSEAASEYAAGNVIEGMQRETEAGNLAAERNRPESNQKRLGTLTASDFADPLSRVGGFVGNRFTVSDESARDLSRRQTKAVEETANILRAWTGRPRTAAAYYGES